MCFGLDGASWDEEKVLERYELLYEAGLIKEARRDGRETARTWGNTLPGSRRPHALRPPPDPGHRHHARAG